MKNKTRMTKVAGKTCFVGPPYTLLASMATLNLFDNPKAKNM